MSEIASLTKEPRRARMSGCLFEQLLAGLVFLRLRAERRWNHPDLRFLVATNVECFNPLDDLVVHLRWQQDGRERRITYFVQLKHAESAGWKVAEDDLVTVRNKNFCLERYYGFYKRMQALQGRPEEELSGNERVLREWARYECRFVLFTNMEVLPEAKDRRAVPVLDFPFGNLFNTGQGEVFTFGETDAAVWAMKGGEDAFHTEFLPRLWVFSGQARATALELLLDEALRGAFGGPLLHVDIVRHKYCSFLQRWWDGDEDALTERHCTVEEILKTELERWAESRYLLFRDVAECKEKLRTYAMCYVVVDDIPNTARCSKILQVLNEKEIGPYVVITDETFKKYSPTVLETMCRSLCEQEGQGNAPSKCFNVVLNVDEPDNDVLPFVRSVASFEWCRLIFVSPRREQRVHELLLSIGKSYGEWRESWALGDVADEEQSELLRGQASFQGREVPLAQLERAWPSLRRDARGVALSRFREDYITRVLRYMGAWWGAASSICARMTRCLRDPSDSVKVAVHSPYSTW